MNHQHATEIVSPATKAAIAWGAAGTSSALPAIAQFLGVSTWAEAAQFAGFCSGCLASILTFCYLVDWFLKRVWRPLFVYLGWVKPAAAIDEMERVQ